MLLIGCLYMCKRAGCTFPKDGQTVVVHYIGEWYTFSHIVIYSSYFCFLFAVNFVHNSVILKCNLSLLLRPSCAKHLDCSCNALNNLGKPAC